MKTSITGALAFLLFAGASSAALAQDHDHDRGGQPQGRQGGPPQAPPAAAARAPGMGAGGHGGAPGGAAPQIQRGGERFGQPGGPRGERFAPGAAQGPGGERRVEGARRPDGERRFQGGGEDRHGPPAGEQRWDRGGAPHEVVPPGRADRGWERDHGGDRGHSWNGGDRGQDRDRDHSWNGGDRGRDRDHGGDHDHGWNGSGGPHWNRGEHWERGRLPPVFWSQHRYHLGRYRPPYGFYARDWGFGDFLPGGWFGESYWVGDFLDYDLPYPPPGYVWVRVGGDAIMVDRFTGRIVQVVRGIFW